MRAWVSTSCPNHPSGISRKREDDKDVWCDVIKSINLSFKVWMTSNWEKRKITNQMLIGYIDYNSIPFIFYTFFTIFSTSKWKIVIPWLQFYDYFNYFSCQIITIKMGTYNVPTYCMVPPMINNIS